MGCQAFRLSRPRGPSRGFSSFVTDVRTGEDEQVDADYIDWVKEEMRNTYADCSKTVKTPHRSRRRVPHREILRKARKEDVDMIIMGAHTREEDIGAARYRSVVGSTMQKVAKSARCPVVIISRPCTTCWRLFSNIVFGTDFSNRPPVPSSGPPNWPKMSAPVCTFSTPWTSMPANRGR